MLSKKLIHPFRAWWKFIGANILLGVFIMITFFNYDYNPKYMLIATVWSALISITQWLGHAYIQGKIDKKYNWLAFPRQRFFLTVVSIVVYSFVAYAFVQVVMNFAVSGQSPIDTMKVVMRNWTFPVFISFAISLITGANGFLIGWKNSVVKQEQLKAEMLEYKYEALKNQINPHFMFNSLNVLTELVYEDKEQAVEFIHKFSDIYRYVLDSRDKEIRPLSDEIAFIEKFVFLLKIRFEDKLQVHINVTEKEGQMIVPLALQLLVENAVKHNEVSSEFPLVINIQQEGDKLVVFNVKQKKKIQEESSGIGLNNLKSQYQYFSDDEVVVEESKCMFKVIIPIVYES